LKTILPGPKHEMPKPGDKFEYLEEFDETSTNPSAEGGRTKG